MTEQNETINNLRDALRLCVEKSRRLQADLTRLTRDVRAVREVAQAHGWTWNPAESVEGFVRNLVCACDNYRQIIENRP